MINFKYNIIFLDYRFPIQSNGTNDDSATTPNAYPSEIDERSRDQKRNGKFKYK